MSSDYEKVEKIYFLIGKAYEETGAGYLLISFSYEQTAAAYEEIETRIQLASATFFGYPKSINCMAFQLAIYFLYYFLIVSDRVKLWHSCNCLFLQPKKVALGT